MKKNRIILSILCCLPLLLSAQQRLTLEECIRIALENNRNVKQQKLNKESRTIAYHQARANLLPNLNGSMGQSFVFGRSIGLDNTYKNTNSAQTNMSLSSDITLFDGLRMKHNIDARKADMNAAQADMEQMENEIRMSVSTAFLQVLLNKELLQIANDQMEVTKTNIERRQELVKSGKVAQGELYELEAQQAKEQQNKIQAENNVKLSLLDLAQIMEITDFQNLDIVSPSPESLIQDNLPPSSQAIYDAALLSRPEIRASQYRLESSQKEVSMAKAGHFPTLSFGAGAGTAYHRMSGLQNAPFSQQLKNNVSASLGFSLSIPIFNRFQVSNNVKSAQITVENNRLEADKIKIELRKKIEQAYYNALAAESRWQAAQKSEKAGREAYRFAEQKYENGRANSYELYQAKSNLAQILAEQAQAKYEYAFRLKILELLKN